MKPRSSRDCRPGEWRFFCLGTPCAADVGTEEWRRGGVDILVYAPEEFAAMREQGNAFAEMVVEEGRLIYGREAPG
jgi:hypothetical protein